MSLLHKYNDSKNIGPGVWFTIHLLCNEAILKGEYLDFLIAYNIINTVINKFPSTEKEKLKLYVIKGDPIVNYDRITDKDGKIVREFNSLGLAKFAYNLHSALVS